MRCFIAIDVPEEVKSVLVEIQKRFKEFDYSFTPKETLHLTIRFLGEISLAAVKTVEEHLSLVKHARFTCTLTEIDAFPSREHARVLWVGLEKTKEMEELKRQIDALVEHDVKNEDTPSFIPHITIGRSEYAPDIRHTKVDIPRLSWTVDSFVLKESIVRPNGAVHAPVKTYPLGENV